MTEIHAFDPDGTASPGAQIALDGAVAGLASEGFVSNTVAAIPDATDSERGLMAATDKAHLDSTPTRAEVAESMDRTLVERYSLGHNFEGITPRFVTRPDIRVNNVMQSFGRTSTGHYYIAQAVSVTDDLSISRCDAGGRIIDTSILTGRAWCVDRGGGAAGWCLHLGVVGWERRRDPQRSEAVEVHRRGHRSPLRRGDDARVRVQHVRVPMGRNLD